MPVWAVTWHLGGLVHFVLHSSETIGGSKGLLKTFHHLVALSTLVIGIAAGASVSYAGVIRSGCAVGFRPLGSSEQTWAAVVRRPLEAYAAPRERVVARFGTLTVNGVPTVFGVLGKMRCAQTWYRVQLPIRPNGATGWVRAADVTLAKVDTRITVDLSAHRVALYRRGRVVLRTRAAVGAPGTPTPVGRFYVNQRLVPLDRSGPFGPGAVGISAFSPTLKNWAQGGPIAIHGTNEPWSIGKSVSNGCIRIRNDVLRRVFAAVRAGTPVLIRR
jgi:lipoprotein-anchoring transpeptidase ErfK/SrfK